MKINVRSRLVRESVSRVVEEVVEDEVRAQLVGNKAFQKHIRSIVNAEVQAQAPGNPRIQEVIREVQEHLDRYPAIAHDIGLQEAVGQAIFTYLQKTS